MTEEIKTIDLRKEIDKTIEKLNKIEDPLSEEYSKTLVILSRLKNLSKNEEKDNSYQIEKLAEDKRFKEAELELEHAKLNVQMESQRNQKKNDIIKIGVSLLGVVGTIGIQIAAIIVNRNAMIRSITMEYSDNLLKPRSVSDCMRTIEGFIKK